VEIVKRNKNKTQAFKNFNRVEKKPLSYKKILQLLRKGKLSDRRKRLLCGDTAGP